MLLRKSASLVLCCIASALLVQSCGKQRAPGLVGTWASTQGKASWQITFESNGEGTYKRLPDYSAHHLSWDSDQNVLSLKLRRGVDSMSEQRLTYKLSSDGKLVGFSDEIAPGSGKSFSKN